MNEKEFEHIKKTLPEKVVNDIIQKVVCHMVQNPCDLDKYNIIVEKFKNESV